MRTLAVLSAVVALAHGIVFSCLDKCDCDTSSYVIHCHDGGRTELVLPEYGDTLRGFHTIGMTKNRISKLPDQATLLKYFPDLLAIDVEGNPTFDCSTVADYSKVKILSDCGKSPSDILDIPSLIMPKKEEPTRECDYRCTLNKYYKQIKEWMMKAWSYIKDKYNNFNQEDFLQSVKQFFREAVENFRRD